MKSSNTIKLSILDIGTIMNGKTASETMQDSISLAKLADDLGYTRYWFAEHHNTPFQVSTSPELMSVHAAANTKNIRVGSGGIMLPNHSPLRVAENFLTLEAMYPGRLDLGIGRAPGTDGLTAYALRRSREAVTSYDFPEQLNEMLGFFSKDFPADHPYSRIIPFPGITSIPDIYMLGSSNGGVQFAMEKGLGFVFASHLAPHLAVPMLRAYKENFKPSRHSSEPKSIFSTILITAETDEEAQYLAGPVELFWARLNTGNLGSTFPTLEEASQHHYTPAEAAARAQNKDKFIIGGINSVKQRLETLAEQAMVDEFMLLEYYTDQAARHKAYQLLASEFLH
ncbi:LLM class flavin-dependent oxidoreductase [Paenibacillus sp. JCM 10914]|uniref:LLM class flavin-dependent oxidoreductase n=1 Tax=Paenibacillus sp. JCM 10914 TaxID=1236974 RepID=UPI00055E586E|nr:LLM class flavin-dependent oxidoreductase [Paenibacillus sp. JCM 10914]